MSDDYLCLTVFSHPGEAEPAFKSRLSQFWTHMLRDRKADFEKVYAETTQFTSSEGRLSRQYLVEADVIDSLERELAATGIAHEPIDRDDRYSKYEATPPDWMWIEH
jgi:hypothetical protein